MSQDIDRIKDALDEAGILARGWVERGAQISFKSGGDPVTEADVALNDLLRRKLVSHGDGWLSEEEAPRPGSSASNRMWIVDPIDGSREFIAGVPEWSVSVALIEDGRAVAGGVLNPMGDQMYLGISDGGVTRNGESVHVSNAVLGEETQIVASRSEVNAGQWSCLNDQPFTIVPTGSIAYKLALVAAGQADGTISLSPKNEWDVAAGALLVLAAGGEVTDLLGHPLTFDASGELVNGIIAAGPNLAASLRQMVSEALNLD
jgi:myo-inositol-1(or 4)-monophosphatase